MWVLPSTGNRRLTLLYLVSIAILIVALNALKPLCVDDYTYCEYAHHIATNPLRPYGFETTFGHDLSPALYVQSPPTFLYWWALGIRVLGESPIAWKLWSFPIVLVGAISFYAMARRLTNPSMAMGLVVIGLMSPAILPSVNMMLDVPALSIGWLAIALLMYSLDCRSIPILLLSGIVAGLAMQTKYTTFAVPIAMVLWGCHKGQEGRSLLSAFIGFGLFVGSECWIAFEEGQSHFVYALEREGGGAAKRCLQLLVPHVTQVGAFSLPLLLMAIHGLYKRRWLTLGLASVYLGVFGACAVLPRNWQVLHFDSTGLPKLEILGILFATSGFLTLFTGIHAISRLWAMTNLWRRALERTRRLSVEEFLLCWLLAEVCLSIAMSPFEASRRVFGILLVSLLIMGRFLHHLHFEIPKVAFASSLVLGFGYFTIDYLEAASARDCLVRACYRIDDIPGQETRRTFVAQYGARYYAQTRIGWSPIIHQRTKWKEGDLVVVLHSNGYDPPVDWQGHSVAMIEEFSEDDPVQLTTWGGFYSGATPIKSKRGPRSWANAYRVGPEIKLAKEEKDVY